MVPRRWKAVRAQRVISSIFSSHYGATTPSPVKRSQDSAFRERGAFDGTPVVTARVLHGDREIISHGGTEPVLSIHPAGHLKFAATELRYVRLGILVVLEGAAKVCRARRLKRVLDELLRHHPCVGLIGMLCFFSGGCSA